MHEVNEQTAATQAAYPSQKMTGAGMAPTPREGIMPDIARCAGWCRGALSIGIVALGIVYPSGHVRAQEAAPAGGGAVIASAGEVVLLREAPGYDAVVLSPLSEGTQLDITGEPVFAADG